MLSALSSFPCQDNDKVAKAIRGIISTKKFPKDSEIYFQSSDNYTTVKG